MSKKVAYKCPRCEGSDFDFSCSTYVYTTDAYELIRCEDCNTIIRARYELVSMEVIDEP